MAVKLKTRSEVPLEDRWNLEAMYATDEDWEREFRVTADFASQALNLSGSLGLSADSLLRAIEELISQDRIVNRLLAWATMKKDEDLGDSHYSGIASRISSRNIEVSTAHSFFVPELLTIPAETIESWLSTTELESYRVWLIDVLRYRPHTLSSKEEEILAASREIARGFGSVFGKLNNVDMPARLPEVKDENGESVQLTNGNYTAFLQSGNSDVRRGAYRGFYSELSGNIATQAALLEGQVRTNSFYARVRKHPSALAASLFNDGVETSVYDSLIESVHRNLPVLHRYYGLRKEVLGLDPMNLSDIYVPVVPEERGHYSWDEAVDLSLEAVAPLGEQYVAALARGFKERWVDKYENRGKRSGAYSGGCYDSHPYILHNFNGTLLSVFTLVHEAGHSMHSLLSRETQPYHMSSYKIILAEVASVTNEMLLVDLLAKRLKDSAERAYLLDHLIGKFRSTLIRQTMFAEFERSIHEHVESGESLTPDYLCESYYALVKQYHGENFAYDDADDMIAFEWSKIPHFYYNFYVYKYATGLASAVAISNRIIEGEDGIVERYLNFLRGGASKPPLDLLADTGVDLRTSEPVDSTLAKMDSILEDLEGILIT